MKKSVNNIRHLSRKLTKKVKLWNQHLKERYFFFGEHRRLAYAHIHSITKILDESILKMRFSSYPENWDSITKVNDLIV